LVLGCGALLWQQGSEPPPPETQTAELAAIIEPADVIEEVARIVEAPRPAPTLQRAMFDPRIAANGKQSPRDGRLDEGVLVVRSTPAGARVTVNGVGWGVTPVAIRYLPFGTVRIRLGKTNYVSQERTVRLSPEEPSQVLRVALPGLPRKPDSRVASSSSADMLVITTMPAGARVTVNGIGWGITPVSIPHIPAGEQRVRVVKDDFRSEERVVTVGNGRPARVAIALKPLS
jgi:hypothetical protein